MANYQRKPNYHFKDKNSTGLHKVPDGRVVVIEDYDGDGSGKIKSFIKKKNITNANADTTIEEFLNDETSTGSIGSEFHTQEETPAKSLGAKWYKPSEDEMFTCIEVNGNLIWKSDTDFIKGALTDFATKSELLSVASLSGGNVAMTIPYRFELTEDTSVFNIPYIPGSISVYINGMLIDAEDYTANDGTSINLDVPAADGDNVTIIAYGGADVYSKNQIDTLFATKASLDTMRIEQPVLSANSGGFEGTDVNIKITNYNSELVYKNLQVDNGTVSISGDTIKLSLPELAQDVKALDCKVEITASGNGKVDNTGSIIIKSLEFNPVTDQVALFENGTMTSNEYTNLKNVDLTGDLVTHNTDVQDLKVLPESTKTLMFVDGYNVDIQNGDTLAVDGVKVQAKNILIEGNNGLVNSKDPFDDGSLIAKYLLDGDAKDLLGNYNGTWDGTESYTNGKFYKCISIGQSTSDCADSIICSNLNSTGNSQAVSFWMKHNGIHNKSNMTVVDLDGYDDNDNGAGFGLWLNDSGNYSFVTNRSYDHYDINISQDEWHHVVMTYDGTDAVMYLDNTEVKRYTVDINAGSTGLRIGNRASKSEAFGGYIDQVEVYNKNLTDSEITALYEQDIKKYRTDISELNLDTAPEKAKKLPLGSAESVVITQDDDDTDWIKISTQTKNKAQLLKTYSKSTSEVVILEGQNVYKGDKLLIGSDENLKEIELQDNITDLQTDSKADIFGDGSCIALYEFSDNANDTSGNYNGTWSSNEAYSNAKFGHGASFNGEYHISTSTEILPDNRTHSVSFWLRVNSNDGDRNRFIQLNKDINIGMWIENNNTQIDLSIYKDSDNYIQVETDFTMGVFEHWVYIWDKENIKGSVYKNGEFMGSNTMTNSDVSSSDGNSGFGSCRDGVVLDIILDQVRIFNRVLTQDEINVIYKEELPKVDISSLNLTEEPTIIAKDTAKVFSTISADETDLDSNYVELQKDSVIADADGNIKDTTDILDIFNDGSCKNFYKFEDNLNDESGNNNGTIDGTEEYVEGKFNKAIRLNDTELDTYSDAFIKEGTSFSFFIKGNITEHRHILRTQTDLRFLIASADDDANYYGLYLGDGDSWNTLEKFHFSSSGDTSADEFNHIVFSYDGTTAKIYYNSELVKSINWELPCADEWLNFQPGKNADFTIDHFRIFNRGLSDEEVVNLYNEKINNIPSEITTIFKDDARQGRSFKHKLELDYKDAQVQRVQINLDKKGE